MKYVVDDDMKPEIIHVCCKYVTDYELNPYDNVDGSIQILKELITDLEAELKLCTPFQNDPYIKENNKDV